AQLEPKLYQPSRQFRGDAFTYGSTAQSVEEKSLTPAPGMALKVPLY
ncbi:MAG: hypothetical protein JO264_07675, partial [Acidisphaera sp.]|nr:hypothetical protein [Acidisphaera sp.]